MTLPWYKNCTSSPKERLEQFRSSLKTVKEVEEIQAREFGEKSVEKGKEKWEALSEDQFDEAVDRSNKLTGDMVKAIEQGLKPSSKEVQEVIQHYYNLLTEFNPVTKEIFLKFRDCVLTQRDAYIAYHPKMPEFFYEAMSVFAATFFQEEK
jgi:hypothetical protein